MSRTLSTEELFDVCFDLITIVTEGHKALKNAPMHNRSGNAPYRRAQRFCYGVVEKNLRDTHNALYGDGKSLIYSSSDALPLTKKSDYRIEHSLPIVELASKWYAEEYLAPKTVIRFGIFNPIVKLTIDEDKALRKVAAPEPRVSPYAWSDRYSPRKSCYSYAHTNPDYDHPFARNQSAGHVLLLVHSAGATQHLNDLSRISYNEHLSNIDQTHLGNLRKELESSFGQ